MKKPIRIFLTVLLTAVFLFSTVRFLHRQWEKAAGSAIYADALALATAAKPEFSSPELSAPEPDDPHMQMLAQLDLEALRQVNPDVVGWILIPDTPVNYPLMHSSDNNYYLNRTWNREPYGVGSVFLESLCRPDFTDFHTIVYGHNMNDGSMFGSLSNYRKQEYLQSHPYVYIRGDFGVYRYEIVSSRYAATDSDTYGIGFTADAGSAGASNEENTTCALMSIPGRTSSERGTMVRTSKVRVAGSTVGDFHATVLPPILVSPTLTSA